MGVLAYTYRKLNLVESEFVFIYSSQIGGVQGWHACVHLQDTGFKWSKCGSACQGWVNQVWAYLLCICMIACD